MYFIALRGNTPPRIQEGIPANTDVIRGKEVSFFCAASGKYVVDTNYFNISKIWFLVVDFRACVGLPLITETLKFVSEIWFLIVDFRAYVGLPLITETLKFISEIWFLESLKH